MLDHFVQFKQFKVPLQCPAFHPISLLAESKALLPRVAW
jgi:hypothetical protein